MDSEQLFIIISLGVILIILGMGSSSAILLGLQYWQYNNTNLYVINDSYNVAIGKQVASEKLDIQGNVKVNNTLYITNNAYIIFENNTLTEVIEWS